MKDKPCGARKKGQELCHAYITLLVSLLSNIYFKVQYIEVLKSGVGEGEGWVYSNCEVMMKSSVSSTFYIHYSEIASDSTVCMYVCAVAQKMVVEHQLAAMCM